MRAPAKIGLVCGGYAAAALLAYKVVALHVAATSTPDRQSAAGMYAFGDSLFFLAAFAAAAMVPTAAALYLLRGRERFWRVLSVGAAVVAATALPAPFLFYLVRTSWAGLSVLRVLIAPVLSGLFFLAGALAPSRSPRLLLLACGVVEAVVFASVAIGWFHHLGGR
jgi:hypothetical protein